MKYINLKGNKIKDSKLNEKILSTLATKGFTIIINWYQKKYFYFYFKN